MTYKIREVLFPMIRFLLTASFVVLFLILSIPLLVIEWIIGKFNMDIKNRSSLAIVNWAFRCVIFLSGGRPEYIGEENVPKDQAVLYVGNHRSYFDIVLTYVRVPRPTGYIAKAEMIKVPLLSNWMKNLHCLFLDRSDIKKGLKTILEGIEKVKSGISICIFPEGSRCRDENAFLPFHEGSLKIAEKSGCPIVPMAICNSSAIWEDHLPFMKKSRVIIEYGKPIIPSELSKEDRRFLGAYVQKEIEKLYFKNKALL